MTYFVIILIAFFFATQLILETLKSSFYDQRQRTLVNQANMIAGLSETFLKQQDKELLHFEFTLSQQSEKIANTRILIVENSPIPRYVADTNPISKEQMKGKYPPEGLVGYMARGETHVTVDTIKDDTNMHIVVPVKDQFKSNTVIGAVHLVSSINDIEKTISEIQQKLYLLNLLVGIIVGIMSYFFSNMITKPTQHMIEVIEQMAHGQLEQRIKIYGNDEIAELGKAFNSMAEQLEQVDQSRHEFVSNASHELRTPLSSMKVLIQSLLIQEGQSEEIYREFLRDINSEIDRLTNIINDLLDMVKLDKLAPLNLKEVSMTELIYSVVKRMQPLADLKNINIVYEPAAEIVAKFDEIKVTQAISNLIDNAIKYSNEWTVVDVKLAQDPNHVIVQIKDHGIGIPKEDLNKIFERFYRVDKMRSRDSGGTGLGLSITQKAIIMHGGKIMVDSEVNEGTTFTLFLPKN